MTSPFSETGLARMHEVLAGYVERQVMPGLVALVSCGEDVHVDAIGSLAFTSSAAMTQDAIFRIASLSKVVVAVAAMQLVEDCTIRLNDPVTNWLPELADRRVLRSLDAQLDDTVVGKRAITVRDVLTYRMGFGSVMARPGTYPIQGAIHDLQIGGDSFPRPSKMLRTDEWLRNLGSLPWMAQPGEEWMYHVSGDVLGVLIARASGKTLGTFFWERIFNPLGMNDSGFSVPPEKISRLTAVYGGGNGGTRTLFDDPAASAWVGQLPFESGGGGLVSTVRDYFTFQRMLLNGGTLGGQRILSPASVSLMCSDQVSAAQRQSAGMFFQEHSSWAMGFAVDIDRREIYHSPGRFGWTGGLGTTCYTDPANNVIGMLFTQRLMDSPTPPKFFDDFWNCAYAALQSAHSS